MMTIQEMTAREAWEYFRDLGQRGFLAMEGEDVVGWMGFNSDDLGLYVHSVFCTGETHACASLVQAVIRLAKDLKIENIRYVVDENNPHFLRLVDSGRASVQSYIVSFPVKD